MASRALLLPAQMRFVLISAAPPGCRPLENALPRTNTAILKLSGIIQPNLLQDGGRGIVLGTILFSPQKR